MTHKVLHVQTKVKDGISWSKCEKNNGRKQHPA